MHTIKLRQVSTAALAALSLLLTTAAVSHAEINNGGGSGAAVGCKLPGNGTTVASGSTGTDSDGKVYSCTNGVGCQVEGGKVTDKCSHMSAIKVIGTTRFHGPTTLRIAAH